MAAASINARVQKHRDALRMAGLRPLQIWVPDTGRPGFADECRRQSLRVTEGDQADAAMHGLLEQALTEIPGWAE